MSVSRARASIQIQKKGKKRREWRGAKEGARGDSETSIRIKTLVITRRGWFENEQ